MQTKKIHSERHELKWCDTWTWNDNNKKHPVCNYIFNDTYNGKKQHIIIHLQLSIWGLARGEQKRSRRMIKQMETEWNVDAVLVVANVSEALTL